MWLRVAVCASLVWVSACGQEKGGGQTVNSNAPNASSPKVGSASAPQGHFYKMRMVQIMDDQGFGQPVEAVRFLIPSDWRTEGGIQWTNEIRCPLNIIQLIFRATSPDGLSAFEFLPSYTWQAASDPQMMQIIQQQAAMGQGCDAGPVANVGEYLQQRIVARARPGARIIARDPLPAVSQAKQAVLMQAYGAMIQAGYVRQAKADSGSVRLSYSQNGQPVEEWIATTLNTVATPAPNTAALMQGQVNYSAATYYMNAEGATALRAPAGKLDPNLAATIVASIRLNPQYQAAVSQFLTNMSQIAQRGAMDRARIWRDAGQQISSIINQTYQQNQAVQDRAAEQFSQSIRGVETYIQPDGQRVELTGGYDNAWINNRGEYLLSDQPGFNPAVQFQEDWQQLRKSR